MRTPGTLLAAAAALLSACTRSGGDSPFRAPDGFVVERIAAQEQIGSAVALTFDSLGRPVVAQEGRHPVLLIDSNGDGVFEGSHTYTSKVRNLQGMWFDGRTLYAVGQDDGGVTGLYRCVDDNADDTADRCDLLNPFEREMGEHGPHAIRRGIDGEPILMLGNHTGVPAGFVDPGSPLANYHEAQLLTPYPDARGHAAGITAPGGTLVRLNRRDGKYRLLAGGFRNAYDFAVTPEGELLTFDSDMEWDINLPWYRGVRSIHVVPGGDYGWRTGSGKLPGYNLDTLPAMRDLGRGSPVGLEVYTSNVYPKEYQGAYFEADWSRGRILISRPARCGATLCVTNEPVEFLHGEPLNVTDIEVGPDGNLWFTTGGRNTEGGLYRVAYKPGVLQAAYYANASPVGMETVTRQPQPLSSWGHASLLRQKAAMGETAWKEGLTSFALDRSRAVQDRVAALLTLERIGPRPTADLLRPLALDPNPALRAAAVLVASFHGSPRAKAIVTGGLSDSDPFVRRRSLEGMVRMGLNAETSGSFAPVNIVYAALSDRDRFVRYAARVALERYPRESWAALAIDEKTHPAAPEALYALARTAPAAADLDALFPPALELLKQASASAEERLHAIRAFQLISTRREGGAPAHVRQEVHAALASQFPNPDANLDREIARTLAYCGQPGVVEALLSAMPPADENQPLQIHYAYCLRATTAPWSSQEKRLLANWYAKAVEWRGGASFTGYLNMFFDTNLAAFNEEEKRMAWAKIPIFAPLDQQPEPRRNGFIPSAAVVRARGTRNISNQEIFEFQMYSPMISRADPARGRQVFEKECAQCHRHGATGKDFGPDLTTLASRFRRADVLESLLYPSKTISDQYASIIVETKDNDVINGLLVREDLNSLLLKTADVERPIEIRKTNVKARRPSKVSIMPEGILNDLSQNQIADLMQYLLQSVK